MPVLIFMRQPTGSGVPGNERVQGEADQRALLLRRRKDRNGKRVCSDYAIQFQIEYAGRPFCACLGKEIDTDQIEIDFDGCMSTASE
nr:MAG TPA: hypothetical protein [Caudoviricetes sp.]